MTPDELAAAVHDGSIDTVILGFPDMYGRLLGKRMDAEFMLEDLGAGTHACDYLLTADMEMEPVEGYSYSNWASGYGDVHMLPDLATIRRLAWLDRTAFVMCDLVDQSTHELVPVAPRSILKKQIARLAELGFDAMGASELEYVLYRTSYQEAASGAYRDMTPAGWYIEDYHLLQATRTEDLNGEFRRALKASEIPVESTKGEWGRGQHELNIRYCDVLEMADRHLLLKQCVKEVADRHGSSATFMAKVDENEAGSSSHLHLSLWRGEEPAFPGDDDLAGVACSPTFSRFLAGWMAHAGDLLAFLAPTVNSYKRFQAKSWAPTALAWSPDNRTTGFRVVGEGKGLRIECRIPGADVNPHLAFAAALAAGLDGLERGAEPPPPVLGDAYETEGQNPVAVDLAMAAEAFSSSEMARSSFGDEVVDHYTHFFRTEVAAARRAVTDWERVRYFERI